uniref:Uncharacterized protein n=1 Tax=Lepeophtheirus salmonis TaxID=72036 RepID=A0A0K2T1C6_LEPSM
MGRNQPGGLLQGAEVHHTRGQLYAPSWCTLTHSGQMPEVLPTTRRIFGLRTCGNHLRQI